MIWSARAAWLLLILATAVLLIVTVPYGLGGHP